MFFTIILFLVILSILVFVHEAGHFFTARRNGMRVDEFGFGFPPRVGGFVKNDETKKWDFVWGNPDKEFKNTIYSVNWIPLGGFVRIKGEDGSGANDFDSFASKSAWKRLKVLGAGVAMNFVLAWVLFSVISAVGFPRQVDPAVGPLGVSSVQILTVAEDSPAKNMGLQLGDTIVGFSDSGQIIPAQTVEDTRKYILDRKGTPIAMLIERGDKTMTLTGTPRSEYDPGQGALGISMAQVETVKTPWWKAPWEGLKQVGILIWLILGSLWGLLVGLFSGAGVSGDVSGPIGIAYVTRQVSDLGFLYLLQFVAILSVNLGVLNILPIPALDGGRIFFVLIEMLKGSPVSQKTEQWMHSIGFSALLLLMLVVTIYDFSRFHFFERFF